MLAGSLSEYVGYWLRSFKFQSFKNGSTKSVAMFSAFWIQYYNHFTISGNGYIEDKELDGFLIELVTSVNAADVGPEVSQ